MPGPLKIHCYNCDQKLDVSDVPAFTCVPCPSCGVEIIVPLPFGNLLLEQPLGTGLMTVAYRAMDITLEREIVVKVLRDEYLGGTRVPELFIAEARASSAINHPNVVPIYSCGERDDKPYIVTQFMEGGSLAANWVHGDAPPPPVERVVGWFVQAVQGLEAAHLHGILHHDVTPDSILVDLEDNVKIGDFGLLQALYRGEPLLEEPAPRESPPLPEWRAQYVSPERIERGVEDVQGDIYSLGASIYHVLTGHRPFPGVDCAEVLAMHLEQTPRPARELRADVPEALSNLLAEMMARDPGDRPNGYRAIARRLRDLARQLATSRAAAAAPPPRTRVTVAPDTGGARAIKVNADGQVAGSRGLYWLVRLGPPAVILALLLLLALHLARPAWYGRLLGDRPPNAPVPETVDER